MATSYSTQSTWSKWLFLIELRSDEWLFFVFFCAVIWASAGSDWHCTGGYLFNHEHSELFSLPSVNLFHFSLPPIFSLIPEIVTNLWQQQKKKQFSQPKQTLQKTVTHIIINIQCQMILSLPICILLLFLLHRSFSKFQFGKYLKNAQWHWQQKQNMYHHMGNKEGGKLFRTIKVNNDLLVVYCNNQMVLWWDYHWLSKWKGRKVM